MDTVERGFDQRDQIVARMSGADMRQIREALGMSIRAVSRYHGRSEGNFRQMEAGMRPIPKGIAAWFDALDAWIAANPGVPKTRRDVRNLRSLQK